MVISHQINQEPEAPRKRRPDVPLDLETICLKALAKDPGQRYEDCQALADDLRRWQSDEPIQARRLGVAERVVRLVRRNPAVATLTGGVAATLSILFAHGWVSATLAVGAAATLVLWTVVATLVAVQAREEKNRAQTAAAQAQQETKRAYQYAAEARKNETQAREEKNRAQTAAARAQQETKRAYQYAAEARKNAEQLR